MTGDEIPKARVRRRRVFRLVWVIPAIALAVAAWLVYQRIDDLGPQITITFSDGGGLRVGQTPLRYRGIITSVFLCAVTLIAVGLGPTFVGVLTDRVFGSNGLNIALLLMSMVFGCIGAAVAFRARPVLERAFRATEDDAALQAAA